MSRITKSAKGWCGPVALGVGLALLAALSWAPTAEAQLLYGSIVGTVTDQSQAAVPGATVTITNQETNLSRETATNEVGVYTFSTVPTGIYTLKINHPGFKALIQSGIQVTLSNVTRVNLTLELGAVAERIEVSAEAGGLQTDRAEVRAELPSVRLGNLPIPPGRNYQYLFGTIPGFSIPTSGLTHGASPSRSLRFNVNGTSSFSSQTRIDGATSVHIWLPDGVGYVPNVESIQTVTVVTNSFDAEQGLAGGAAINVQLKSGTNQLRGSAFWYHNDNALKAKNTFLPAGQRSPKDITNQWGGTIGGPFRKDKVFFFSSYEGTSERRVGSTFGTVPTLGMRVGDMSASTIPIYDPTTGSADGSGRIPFPGNVIPDARIEPIVKKIIPLIPKPTFDRLTSNAFLTAPFTFDRLRWDSKVNWNASQKLTMFGRFSWLNFKNLNSEVFGPLGGRPIRRDPEGDPGAGHGGNYAGSVGGTYILRPNFILDANFGYNLQITHIEQGRLDENVGLNFFGIPGTNGTRRFEGGVPRIQVARTGIQSSDFTEYGVCCPFMPANHHDPQFQYQGNAGWTKGTHNIRFGVEMYTQQLNHQQPEIPGVALHGASGGFGFTGGPTALKGGSSPNLFNSWGTFLLGLSSFTGKIQQIPDVVHIKSRIWSLYARDQWQVTPKLTLSYGFRWERFPIPWREDTGVERYDFVNNKMLVCGVGVVPHDCGTSVSNRLFSPRAGIAYRVTPTFVIRAGYGLNWDPDTLLRHLRGNYPLLVALNLEAPNSFVWATQLKDGIPPIPAPNLGNGIIDVPRNVAFQSLGEKFIRGYVQSWNFTLEKQLARGLTAQVGYVATRQVKGLSRLDLNVGTPGGGQASMPYNQRFGRTVLTRLLAPGANSHYDSLQATVQRRFTGGVSLNAAYTWSKNISTATGAFDFNIPAIKLPEYNRLNRALAPINLSHNLQISSVAELPLGRGKRFFNGGGVASAIAGGWQVNGIFSVVSGMPFSVTASDVSLNAPGNSPQRADLVKKEVKILGGTGPGQSYFDPLAFAPVTEARFGTVGYNTLKGPTSVELDMGLFRDFKLSERFNLQFRAEAFNVSNTPHWGNPGSNVSSMTRNADGTIRSLGGYTEITSLRLNGRDNVDERLFRLGLRLSF